MANTDISKEIDFFLRLEDAQMKTILNLLFKNSIDSDFKYNSNNKQMNCKVLIKPNQRIQSGVF